MIRFCVGAADPSTSAAAIGDAAAAKATDDEPFAREVLVSRLVGECISVLTDSRRSSSSRMSSASRQLYGGGR